MVRSAPQSVGEVRSRGSPLPKTTALPLRRGLPNEPFWLRQVEIVAKFQLVDMVGITNRIILTQSQTASRVLKARPCQRPWEPLRPAKGSAARLVIKLGADVVNWTQCRHRARWAG